MVEPHPGFRLPLVCGPVRWMPWPRAPSRAWALVCSRPRTLRKTACNATAQKEKKNDRVQPPKRREKAEMMYTPSVLRTPFFHSVVCMQGSTAWWGRLLLQRAWGRAGASTSFHMTVLPTQVPHVPCTITRLTTNLFGTSSPPGAPLARTMKGMPSPTILVCGLTDTSPTSPTIHGRRLIRSRLSIYTHAPPPPPPPPPPRGVASERVGGLPESGRLPTHSAHVPHANRTNSRWICSVFPHT